MTNRPVRFGGGAGGGKTAEVFIGVDYGAQASTAVVMERNEDGSWTVHEVIDGKGLDEIGTAPEQPSDYPSDSESDGPDEAP